MATSSDFVEFVCEQLRGTGNLRFKKMFGEYMVYVDNRPIFLVCDNTVFVKKKYPQIENLMKDSDCGSPYDGAKEHYILDIENVPLCREVTAILKELVPIPEPKKKRPRKKSTEDNQND